MIESLIGSSLAQATPSYKFDENSHSSFCIILLTDRKTDSRQQQYNLRGRGNKDV